MANRAGRCRASSEVQLPFEFYSLLVLRRAHLITFARSRYLLRWNALEVFLKNRKNYMFQFPADKVRKKVFDTLVSILKSAGRTIEPTRFTSGNPQDIMQVPTNPFSRPKDLVV